MDNIVEDIKIFVENKPNLNICVILRLYYELKFSKLYRVCDIYFITQK